MLIVSPTRGRRNFAARLHAHDAVPQRCDPVKTNVIPDEVVLEVDIRTLPGQTAHDVARTLDDALGTGRSLPG